MPDRQDHPAQPRVIGKATVTHAPEAVRMDGYPLLTYGPRADPKARVASTGVPVADVAGMRRAGSSSDAVAARFRITVEEVGQAVRWAEEHPG